MKNKQQILTLGVVAILLMFIAIGLFLWQNRQAEERQISLQVRAQLGAHLKENFCCGLATIKEIHIEGRSAVVTASIVGKLVRGTTMFIQDNTGAHIAPNPQFDEAMHAALRNDLLVSYNNLDRDGYLKYLPRNADRDYFSRLNIEGVVQEHSPYIFGLGCAVRTCDTNTVVYTIDERTGYMIVAWVDQKMKSVKFDGLPGNNSLPAPLFWYISNRNDDGINSKEYKLDEEEFPFFAWKYTKLGDNP